MMAVNTQRGQRHDSLAPAVQYKQPPSASNVNGKNNQS